MNKPAKTNRWTLITLLGVFLAPLLVALYLNSDWSRWQPQATGNYGELIQPVLPVPGLQPEKEPRWTLLLLNCPADCAARLEEMGRIRRALGRLEDRLVVAAVGGLAPLPGPFAALADPGAVLAEELAARSLPPRGVYLVDPRANLMMRYPENYEPGAVLEDLERLLKYSKFGPQST